MIVIVMFAKVMPSVGGLVNSQRSVWSDESVRACNSESYIEAARQHGRQVVTVLDPKPGVIAMAKAVANNAARSQFLSSD